MTVLDAYALIGFLAGEPCADEVEPLLRAGTAMSAANVAETIDRLARLHGTDIEAPLDELVADGLVVVPLDDALARRAGRLRAHHYHRQAMPVSLADCTAAATALATSAPLATSDAPLARLVLAEGGAVTALPDSRGARPPS